MKRISYTIRILKNHISNNPGNSGTVVTGFFFFFCFFFCLFVCLFVCLFFVFFSLSKTMKTSKLLSKSHCKMLVCLHFVRILEPFQYKLAE